MFSFGVWKVSGKLYLNLQTKSFIFNSFRGISLFQASGKAVRSDFRASHCQRSELKVAKIGCNYKTSKHGDKFRRWQEEGKSFVERKVTVSLTTCV